MCLVQHFYCVTEEAEGKKLKWHVPCKTEINDNDFLWKKSNSIIGRTKKNRWENLKHNYVAFQLPRNCIQTIASLFFLRNKFPFIHRVAALLFQSQTRTIKNCWTRNFSLQYQYILQPTVLENKQTYQLDGVKLTKHFNL